ncbi:unnamed protein product [Caenorhabditis auriculariae]|uniref:C-type lectin domain-containing protein n=1 Tax=Caenorhabditis auriculariae TaxID=2777116 RepID=A0A8S1H5J7_9PELO|nr:unnamed protein product [Caenorhabditis auriculariae]
MQILTVVFLIILFGCGTIADKEPRSFAEHALRYSVRGQRIAVPLNEKRNADVVQVMKKLSDGTNGTNNKRKASTLDEFFYIGARRDYNNEGIWYDYITGTILTYFNWENGTPKANEGLCVVMNRQAKWLPRNCTELHPVALLFFESTPPDFLEKPSSNSTDQVFADTLEDCDCFAAFVLWTIIVASGLLIHGYLLLFYFSSRQGATLSFTKCTSHDVFIEQIAKPQNYIEETVADDQDTVNLSTMDNITQKGA